MTKSATLTKTNTRKAANPAALRKAKLRASTPKQTKKAQLIDLLRRDNGANVAMISKKLGWLPHTTRAALTGLRKAGYEISTIKPGNGQPSQYRIIAEPVAAAA